MVIRRTRRSRSPLRVPPARNAASDTASQSGTAAKREPGGAVRCARGPARERAISSIDVLAGVDAGEGPQLPSMAGERPSS